MSWLRRTAFVVVVGAAGAIAAACGSHGNPAGPSTSSATVVAVSVSSASSATAAAASFQLTATATLADGSSHDVTGSATWQSSNPSVATVSARGMVTVVGSGEFDVRATYESVTGTLHLILAPPPVVALDVSGAPVSPVSSFQLKAVASLSDGTTHDVTANAAWQSSDPQLATVSANGYVTAVGSGYVTITATYRGASGTVYVRVTAPATHAIRGVVSEAAPDAHPIAGARVQIVVGDHAFTDAQGAFAIVGLPPGRTFVEVSADGYQSYENEVEVADADLTLDVTLYPTPPKDAAGATATARCNDGTWSWAQDQASACTANGGIAYGVCPGPLCSR